MTKRKTLIFLTLAGILAVSVLTVNFTLADTANSDQNFEPPQGKDQAHPAPGVTGTVADISGTTITLTGKQGFGENATDVTYTVDASSSTVKKISAPTTDSNTNVSKPTETTISVSDIQVGDTLMITGTVSGTTVTATAIMDGKMGDQGPGMNDKPNNRSNTNTDSIASNKKSENKTVGTANSNGSSNSNPNKKDNKQSRGITGTVTAINDTTITLTGKQEFGENATDVTYTVDTSSATITEGVGSNAKTLSISDINVGDTLKVAGTISDQTITAASISKGIKLLNDNQEQPGLNGRSNNQGDHSQSTGFLSKFFSSISNFFSRLFSFGK
ncbi:MAG: DUF5666 domain-containing protein [Patescibacteria group bacterium]|jgi:hypothetical protein